MWLYELGVGMMGWTVPNPVLSNLYEISISHIILYTLLDK